MTALPEHSGGFVAFYRRYTKTWLHALAIAALSAFGTLTVLHPGFAVLAVAAYVLPPLVVYFARPTLAEEGDETALGGAGTGTSGDTPPRETDQETGPDAHWTAVDSPTDATLFDVAVTDGDAYAVGEDGVVLSGDGDGDGWRTLLADGPGASSKTLRGVDATTDGEAVWFAGDGGAVGRLDATTGRHVDFSRPDDRTDTWEDVAVGEASDDELVVLVNGSGEVFRGRYRDGDLAWDVPVKPGGGSSLSGVTLVTPSVGYVCDTNDGVFETVDGGESFRRVGVETADGTLTDVAAVARGDCAVTADDGVLHRSRGGTWTPVRLGDEPLEAVAFGDGRGVACGGGAVYERTAGNADWDRSVTPVPGPLVGISAGPARVVAVGDGGAIVERMESEK